MRTTSVLGALMALLLLGCGPGWEERARDRCRKKTLSDWQPCAMPPDSDRYAVRIDTTKPERRAPHYYVLDCRAVGWWTGYIPCEGPLGAWTDTRQPFAVFENGAYPPDTVPMPDRFILPPGDDDG